MKGSQESATANASLLMGRDGQTPERPDGRTEPLEQFMERRVGELAIELAALKEPLAEWRRDHEKPHNHETWIERWSRATEGGNYAAGLAMLREPYGAPTTSQMLAILMRENAKLEAHRDELLALAISLDRFMAGCWPDGPEGHQATLPEADRTLWISARAAIANAGGRA